MREPVRVIRKSDQELETRNQVRHDFCVVDRPTVNRTTLIKRRCFSMRRESRVRVSRSGLETTSSRVRATVTHNRRSFVDRVTGSDRRTSHRDCSGFESCTVATRRAHIHLVADTLHRRRVDVPLSDEAFFSRVDRCKILFSFRLLRATLELWLPASVPPFPSRRSPAAASRSSAPGCRSASGRTRRGRPACPSAPRLRASFRP